MLVVGCEVHSTGIDLSNDGRDVTVLFGDGAGACVVEANDDPRRPERRSSRCASTPQGKYAQKLWIEAPGSGLTPTRITDGADPRAAPLPAAWTGKFVFKHAVTRMPEVLLATLDAASVKKDDVDLFLFHQANLRINEYVAQALEIPAEKLPQQHPALRELLGGLDPDAARRGRARGGGSRPGSLVSMTGFGSGFSWASAVVRW